MFKANYLTADVFEELYQLLVHSFASSTRPSTVYWLSLKLLLLPVDAGFDRFGPAFPFSPAFWPAFDLELLYHQHAAHLYCLASRQFLNVVQKLPWDLGRCSVFILKLSNIFVTNSVAVSCMSFFQSFCIFAILSWPGTVLFKSYL